MADYYEKKRSMVILAKELRAYGWRIKGWKNDESDSMTDYYSPEAWDGVACFGAFTLCVDANYYAQRYGVLATPKGAAWHIEHNGSIIAKGNGVFVFSPLSYHDKDGTYYNGKEARPVSELVAKLDALVAKFNSIVGLTFTKEDIEQQRAEAARREREREEIKREAAYRARMENKKLFLNSYESALQNLPVLEVGDFVRSLTGRKYNDLYGLIEDAQCHHSEVGKIEEIVELERERFVSFLGNLLDDYDFLKGKGGTDCDDERVAGLSYYDVILKDEALHAIFREKSYESKIMVKESGANRYVLVNPHGHTYARYTDVPRSIQKLGKDYM